MNYLNTRDSFDTFMQAVASNIYVDKSMMIEEIMKRTGSYDKYICITRPRRFGKSTNAGMLAALALAGAEVLLILPLTKSLRAFIAQMVQSGGLKFERRV